MTSIDLGREDRTNTDATRDEKTCEFASALYRSLQPWRAAAGVSSSATGWQRLPTAVSEHFTRSIMTVEVTIRWFGFMVQIRYSRIFH
jgi:hypothetical protein